MQQLVKLKNRFIKDRHMNELATHSAFSFIMRVVGLMVNYLFLFFVTRFYGADGWGIFALCFSIIQITSMLGILGINVALVKIVSMGYGNVKELYYQTLKFAIPVNLLLTALVFIFSEQLSKYFGVADGISITTHIRIASLGILPFSISMINSGIFRGNKEIILFSFFDSLGRFLFGFAMVFILHFFSSDTLTTITGFVAGLYILGIFSFRGVNRILNKKYEHTHGDKRDHFPFKELLKLSVPLFWGALMLQGTLWAPTIILGLYVSKEEVGIFDSTNRLAGLLTIILFAINSISGPKFAESLADKNLLRKNINASSKLIFWASVPLFLFLLAGGPFIIKLLEHRPGFNEYFIFVIILIGQLINSLTGLTGTIMQMTGHHVMNQNISMGSFILTTILLFIITPVYGLVGAAIITGLNIALKNIVSVIFIYLKLDVLTIYLPFKRKAAA
ncbi:oligosaccharide flippase family protein [Panacibacter ginsenosidivorans]|uniref:Oligosaccharide flippase family protein n=1 Tax=Panacibacter ginsenosidivorans TaxID=1813871 RepID=A0A5B8V6R0_9BACT|nr:oligosaccharide flippase family protein [Panacibacter ginsenosidivorans]QEC66805.1 oligosaccharide flippase family protein [Panacibacter ginsenosidivorans]